ncbi:hypothetical protein, partial [Klebsiella pneumoniae]|uniref:hypothetical protein n=1 Tax=Klebsiella pneumoniae TaxID=573 RepID=UPI000F09C996
KSAQIREILISESAWEEMTCLFAPSIEKADKRERTQISMSFVKMKDVLFNVLAIGTVLAALVVIFYEVQSSL